MQCLLLNDLLKKGMLFRRFGILQEIKLAELLHTMLVEYKLLTDDCIIIMTDLCLV